MDLAAPNSQLRVRFSSLLVQSGAVAVIIVSYGLGIDNLVRVQIVLPDGCRMTASADAESNIIWAIKGGGNNFGIAVEFVLKTNRQGTNENGYGRLLTFNEVHAERVKGAIVDFMTKNDPKAGIVAAFRFYRNHGVQEFKFTGRLANSNYTTLDVAMTLLYPDLLADVATEVSHSEDGDSAPWSFPSSELAGMGVTNARVRCGTVMVSGYTPNLINVVVEEAKAAKQLMEKHKGRMVVAGHFSWPHKRGEPYLVYFVWEARENDGVWIDQMKTALPYHRIALQEGCTTPSAPVYCNTTLEDVGAPEQIYRGHLDRLSVLRINFDLIMLWGGRPFPFGPSTVDEQSS
ncbi:hypothetical protein EDB85DRAFT_2293668 [Lactarius pseudohatsudake]|nr:hypothetical protein EDB85DRAFT_2293668 [Lactarius pseudohatsudake]